MIVTRVLRQGRADGVCGLPHTMTAAYQCLILWNVSTSAAECLPDHLDTARVRSSAIGLSPRKARMVDVNHHHSVTLRARSNSLERCMSARAAATKVGSTATSHADGEQLPSPAR